MFFAIRTHKPDLFYFNPGPKYAKAKIAVWWHINDCPVPVNYSASRVRQCIERKLEIIGFSLSGPLSITAYGNQNETPDHVLRGLASTGVDIQHVESESAYSLMYSDIVEWRRHNPPPATLMIISNLEDAFFWDLVLLQQRELGYNLAVAGTSLPSKLLYLDTFGNWEWLKLLEWLEDKRSESAMFHCKSCCYIGQSLHNFRKHLSSKQHALQEGRRKPTDQGLASVPRMLGENYPAKPEYATAQIVVFWDMTTCPIPSDYDARRVRSSIESEFKNLGYSGPVSITAFGDLLQLPSHVLQGLTSTGVSLTHAVSEKVHSNMSDAIRSWLHGDSNFNHPPTAMMLISDAVDDWFFDCLVRFQQMKKFNIFLAFASTPHKACYLQTSAHWSWESLLAVPETRRHLRKCTTEKGESITMFNCLSCSREVTIFDEFLKHLSSKKHALEDANIKEYWQRRKYKSLIYEESSPEVKTSRKRKRMIRTDF